MPTVAYEVIVSQSGNQSENVAVANASKWLAYADTTNTIGYANIFDVNVYGGESSQDYGIGLCIATPIGSLSDKARFEREVENLSKVETFEEVHYQRLDKSEA
jgi:hypothetical protein